MKWLLLLLLVILLFIILVIFTKVKIHIDFFHGNQNDNLTVTLKAWGGIIKYKKEIPMIKIDEDSPSIVIKEKTKTGPDEKTQQQGEKQFEKEDLANTLNDTKQLIDHVVGLHTHIRKLLSKVIVRKFEWHTGVGIGDAAATGVICGGVWAAKGSLVGLISNLMKLRVKPVLTVTPFFQQFTTKIQLKCIFQIRVGHAIWTGMKLIKYWKGGMPNFKTKPLSVLSNDKSNSV
ncbi:Protein of unknown function [Mesobacillus persicus]|uniref:DUF2953 domain-containing protein n=2 Tax=Mesobacillus persicus TaxID=930146 RepID=A0A1H7XXH6_9BACI|nr:Protein of unknown function [Mesobacillus persicus]